MCYYNSLHNTLGLHLEQYLLTLQNERLPICTLTHIINFKHILEAVLTISIFLTTQRISNFELYTNSLSIKHDARSLLILYRMSSILLLGLLQHSQKNINLITQKNFFSSYPYHLYRLFHELNLLHFVKAWYPLLIQK